METECRFTPVLDVTSNVIIGHVWLFMYLKVARNVLPDSKCDLFLVHLPVPLLQALVRSISAPGSGH